jgi:YD repeat-containing protein
VIEITGTAPNQTAMLASAGTLVSSTSTSYDTQGRVAMVTDSTGAATQHTYNRFGDATETRTQSLDASGTVVWLVTRTVYDESGRPVLQTDPYLETRTSNQSGTSPPVLATRSFYDGYGRVPRIERRRDVVVEITASRQSTWLRRGTLLSASETRYNARGQVARTVAADGQTTDYESDPLGRRTATIGHILRRRRRQDHNTPTSTRSGHLCTNSASANSITRRVWGQSVGRAQAHRGRSIGRYDGLRLVFAVVFLLVLAAHDGEGVEDLGRVESGDAVQVEEGGVEFRAEQEATRLVPAERRPGVAAVPRECHVTFVRSRFRTRTSSTESVAKQRVRPSRSRNSTSTPSGGSNSTTVPTSPTSTGSPAGQLVTATRSKSFGCREFAMIG